MEPYFDDGQGVTLYLGDMREVVPALDLTADCLVLDPPYAETSLAWDRWPDGWPALAATAARSMWCFGSMRMFLDRRGDFDAAAWKLSQDIVWEKPNGTGFATDRFRRVHEFALHWYLGEWRAIHHVVPTEGVRKAAKTALRTVKPTHTGDIGSALYVDDGSRLSRSVVKAANMHGRSLHPTEKPVGILDPLIRYACPPGGLVLDLFAGSGSTLDAARQSGRRAVGIEAHEPYAEAAAKRLSQMTFADT
jgi:site-specific DNA-methyltransferase (adenine-specific)